MSSNNILENLTPPQKNNRYGKLSFKFLIISILIIGLIILFLESNNPDGMADYIPWIIFGSFTASASLGIIISISSLVRKEDGSTLQIISLIGNALIFLLMIGLNSLIIYEFLQL